MASVEKGPIARVQINEQVPRAFDPKLSMLARNHRPFVAVKYDLTVAAIATDSHYGLVEFAFRLKLVVRFFC